MLKAAKIGLLTIGTFILLYFIIIGFSSCISIIREKKYFRNISSNEYSNKEIISQLSDTLKNRAKGKLFYFRAYEISNMTNWSIDRCFYSNKKNDRIIFYVNENSCEQKKCTSEIMTIYAERITDKFYFTSGESLAILPGDFNWPDSKRMPFSMLSKIARDYMLPAYLKQKYWWNPFDFEINDELFKHDFPMEGKSDSAKIKYFTKDWKYGERQPLYD